MNDDRDFLDEVIEESTAKNPNFPQLMEQARRNRDLLSTLAVQRKRRKVSQTVVAAAMGTSQSSVSTLEKTTSDTMVSTVERYAAALGYAVQFHLVPLQQAAAEPAVVVHDDAE